MTARTERIGTIREDLAAKEESLRGVSRRLEDIRVELRENKQLELDLVEEKAKEKSLREHLEASIGSLTEKQAVIEQQLESCSEEELDQWWHPGILFYQHKHFQRIQSCDE